MRIFIDGLHFLQQSRQVADWLITGVRSWRYECVMWILNFLTRDSASRYRQPLRNNVVLSWVLRSANAKNHYYYFFFYKINKGDLPLMYSCVFWCEFIDLVGFLAVIVWPLHVTIFTIQSKGSTQKQLAVATLSARRRFAARKPIESQIFSTRG